MKGIILITLMMFFTGCGAKGVIAPSDGDLEVSRILDFRTNDVEPMKAESRLILDIKSFEDYLSDYAIIENPAFLEIADLEYIKDIDEDYFKTGAIGVAVSVESSGSNSVSGKIAKRQGQVLILQIERKEASIGTSDIATRHSIFFLKSADVSGVKTVEVDRITKK